jgi:multiple sugar transport system substrate-binding protein
MKATAQAFAELNPNVHIDWETRSLIDFGFGSLAELCEGYDLLLIDHPHIGPGGGGPGVLEPLDLWMPGSTLAESQEHSVGLSQRSYQWQGHQWAMAVDAAAQVSAFRPDLLPKDSLPRTWADVVQLARDLPEPLRLGMPLVPIDIACALLSLCANLSVGDFWTAEAGFERGVLEEALEMMSALVERCHPVSIACSAPQILEELARRDDLVYVPLVFGYSNYARKGFRRHVLGFADIPSTREAPVGSVLGGAGLAISARASNKDVAASYVAQVASGDWQRGVVFESGGQPADRRAWEDEDVNTNANSFFRNTLETLELAYMRPRIAEMPHSLEVQRRIGIRLHEAIGSARFRLLGGEFYDLERELARSERW